MRRASTVLLTAWLTSTFALAGSAADTVGVVDQDTGIWTVQDVNGALGSFLFGDPRDVPFTGDWDCDGIDTPGLYRRSDGFVYLRNSNTTGQADITFLFGDPADLPLVGDFDSDGCDTVSLYRPSEARFYIVNRLGQNGGGLGAADSSFLFGNPVDVPFVGDFDGDGVDTVGLRRASDGVVYLRNSNTTGIADLSFLYGDPGDIPFAGDWDGDGRDSLGLYRPGTGIAYLRNHNSTGQADRSIAFGDLISLPVMGSFGVVAAPLTSVQFMYVVPSDGLDRQLHLNGTITTSVAAFQTWLQGETGGLRLNVDTFQGSPVITFHRLSVSDAEMAAQDPFIRNIIEDELREAGLILPGKVYAVYYDGSSNFSCGGGAFPPTLVGQVAALYLRGQPPNAPSCSSIPFAGSGQQPGYWEFAMLHEILHTLGFIPACSPHNHLTAHVSDSARDLMWSGDAPWEIPNIELDVGNDDYFDHGMAGCLDFRHQPILTSP